MERDLLVTLKRTTWGEIITDSYGKIQSYELVDTSVEIFLIDDNDVFNKYPNLYTLWVSYAIITSLII